MSEAGFYESLSGAGERLLKAEQKDGPWLVLGDSFASTSSNEYIQPPSQAWEPFSLSRSIPLPDRLFDAAYPYSSCCMGALPSINRVWLSLDHRLFLWDFLSPSSSISSFDELPSTEPITAVGLVPPRPGVFVPEVVQLLVLCTPAQVHLVGLSAPAKQTGEITFYLTSLAASTDGVAFANVAGTQDGRIFLSTQRDPPPPGGIGGDGALYELGYAATEGWFSKRCALRNLTSGGVARALVPNALRSWTAVPRNEWVGQLELDEQRGVMYALLGAGQGVEMLSLPSSSAGGGAPERLTRLLGPELLRQAQTLAPQAPQLDARTFEIASLAVVPPSEAGASKVGLVATTTTGVRVYFTHQRRGWGVYAAPTSTPGRPSTLEVCHVRLPPAGAAGPGAAAAAGAVVQQGAANGGTVVKPASAAAAGPVANAVSDALLPSGSLFIAVSALPPSAAPNGANGAAVEADATDLLVLCAPDTGRIAHAVSSSSPSSGAAGTVATTSQGQQQGRQVGEVCSTLMIDGRTWVLAELSLGGGGAGGANELAEQMRPGATKRTWLVLTHMGAYLLRRKRPVDTLMGVLEGRGGAQQGEVRLFYDSFGRDQTCAQLLAIASSLSSLDLPGNNGPSAYVTDQARTYFFEGAGRPEALPQSGMGMGSSSAFSTGAGGGIRWSGKLEALASVMSRVVRGVWRGKVTKLAPGAPAGGRQALALGREALRDVQAELERLSRFVESEAHHFLLASPTTTGGAPAAASIGAGAGQGQQPSTSLVLPTSLALDPIAAENAAFRSLRLALIQSIEAIAFLLLLVDYDLGEIVGLCSQEDQKGLLELELKDLVCTRKGREVAKGLVNSVIEQQIKRQLSIDAIADILQQRCGSFCNADDVILYKALESMRRARTATHTAEKLDFLRESLRLSLKATTQITPERLREIAEEYNKLRFYAGTIELALHAASSWDSAGDGFAYWAEGAPAGRDQASVDRWKARKGCYEVVFTALEDADGLLNKATAAGGSDPAALSYADADSLRSTTYAKALSSKDEFFHFTLYDWLLSRSLADQLLETRGMYLEAYLSRTPETFERINLLWQLHVRSGRYGQAAAVLANLAEHKSFPVTLANRIEYLSLAVSNAKSEAIRGDAAQFLSELEEKLEVAQVQLEIFREVLLLPTISDQERQDAAAVLDGQLLTISDLYSHYAEPFLMIEEMLLIFHVSDHQDPDFVGQLWETILDRLAAEPPQKRTELLTAKLVELSSRFNGSDVAFPLAFIVHKFEAYSFVNRSTVAQGWLPLALREGGVSCEDITTALDGAFYGKEPPWNTPAAQVYLAQELAITIRTWLSTVQHHQPFPATDIDVALGKYVMALSSMSQHQGAKKVENELTELQREIKRRY